MPTIDTDLLRRTMAAVELADERGEWDQLCWRSNHGCGTAYCFAGWVAQLEGVEWLDDETIAATHEDFAAATNAAGVDSYQRPHPYHGGMWIQDWAAWRLGLNGSQGYGLFDGDNTLDDLRAIVDNLCVMAGIIAGRTEA